MSDSNATERTPLMGTSRPRDDTLLHRAVEGVHVVLSPLFEVQKAIASGLKDYQAVNVGGKADKKPTMKVEPKVWFANERTWISYLNNSILLGTLSLALFNSSSESVGRVFAYIYAAISICVLVYGFALYQYRITLIRKKDAFHFVSFAGPILISLALFTAVLANFIIRVREMQRDRRDRQ